MANKKPALGKGLGALISETKINDLAISHTVASPELVSISEIPLENISPNPFQPRTTFDAEALEELAASIREFGIIQPITVRAVGHKYQIISGERRVKASRMAGMTHIPAYIKSTDDGGMLEMAIVENIQRQDLDAIEIALSFQRLIDECELTQETMAEKVGKKRATVSNYLRLLKLPAEIQVAIRDGGISMGHAKAILSLSEPEVQKSLCDLIMKKGLSVREAEAKAKELLETGGLPCKRPEKDNGGKLPESYDKLSGIIGKFFRQPVKLKRSERGNGSITIRFADDTEVESFLKAVEQLKTY